MANFSVQDTMTKFVDIVAQKLSIDQNIIKPTSCMQDLGADSLDLVEIIMKLEESFGLEIPDEDVAHLNTVQEFVDYIQKNRTK